MTDTITYPVLGDGITIPKGYGYPTLNVDLLAQLLEWAGAEDTDMAEFFEAKGWPRWNQNLWAAFSPCGSTACIAGNAVIQSPNFVTDAEVYHGAILSTPLDDGSIDTAYRVELRDGEKVPGEPVTIRDAATEILGLTISEAGALFNGSNRLSELVWLAQDFAARRGVELPLSEALQRQVDGEATYWDAYTGGHPDLYGPVDYMRSGGW